MSAYFLLLICIFKFPFLSSILKFAEISEINSLLVRYLSFYVWYDFIHWIYLILSIDLSYFFIILSPKSVFCPFFLLVGFVPMLFFIIFCSNKSGLVFYREIYKALGGLILMFGRLWYDSIVSNDQWLHCFWLILAMFVLKRFTSKLNHFCFSSKKEAMFCCSSFQVRLCSTLILIIIVVPFSPLFYFFLAKKPFLLTFCMLQVFLILWCLFLH